MLDHLRDRVHQQLAAQLASMDSPLMQVVTQVQQAVTAIAPSHDVAGTDATTRPGTLAQGARPSAEEIRSAPLDLPGTPDMDRARRDAQRTLDQIDWSRPDIVLWMPKTGSHSIPSAWSTGVASRFPDGSASLALVDYPADANFSSSVSTGMETLRLVLAGIAEHGGGQRVTVAGHSQGAWAIGDSIASPVLGRMVDKAVLYGEPSTARTDWSGSSEPNVRQVADPQDPFTWEMTGAAGAMDAVSRLDTARRGDRSDLDLGRTVRDIGTVAATALENPALATYLLGNALEPESWRGEQDPHHYEAQYADGAGFLAAR